MTHQLESGLVQANRLNPLLLLDFRMDHLRLNYEADKQICTSGEGEVVEWLMALVLKASGFKFLTFGLADMSST